MTRIFRSVINYDHFRRLWTGRRRDARLDYLVHVGQLQPRQVVDRRLLHLGRELAVLLRRALLDADHLDVRLAHGRRVPVDSFFVYFRDINESQMSR